MLTKKYKKPAAQSKTKKAPNVVPIAAAAAAAEQRMEFRVLKHYAHAQKLRNKCGAKMGIMSRLTLKSYAAFRAKHKKTTAVFKKVVKNHWLSDILETEHAPMIRRQLAVWSGRVLYWQGYSVACAKKREDNQRVIVEDLDNFGKEKPVDHTPFSVLPDDWQELHANKILRWDKSAILEFAAGVYKWACDCDDVSQLWGDPTVPLDKDDIPYLSNIIDNIYEQQGKSQGSQGISDDELAAAGMTREHFEKEELHDKMRSIDIQMGLQSSVKAIILGHLNNVEQLCPDVDELNAKYSSDIIRAVLVGFFRDWVDAYRLKDKRLVIGRRTVIMMEARPFIAMDRKISGEDFWDKLYQKHSKRLDNAVELKDKRAQERARINAARQDQLLRDKETIHVHQYA